MKQRPLITTAMEMAKSSRVKQAITTTVLLAFVPPHLRNTILRPSLLSAEQDRLLQLT